MPRTKEKLGYEERKKSILCLLSSSKKKKILSLGFKNLLIDGHILYSSILQTYIMLNILTLYRTYAVVC